MYINWRKIGERVLLIFVTLVVIGSTILALNVAYLRHESFLPNADNWERYSILVSSLAAIINFGLTVAIIYIYIRQSRTLSEEVSVLKDQQELMKTDREPQIDTPYNVRFYGDESSDSNNGESDKISLEDIDWIPTGLQINATVKTESDRVEITTGESTGFENREPKPNSVRFDLSNSGGGIARNFQLWIKAWIHNSETYKGGWARVPLRRLDRYALHAFADNTIQPNEQGIIFEGEVKFKIIEYSKDGKPIKGDTYEFSEGIEYLTENGIKDFSLVLELRYEDIFDQEHSEQFYEHRTDISKDMDLKEFVASEYPTIRYNNTSEQEKSLIDSVRNKVDRLRDRIR